MTTARFWAAESECQRIQSTKSFGYVSATGDWDDDDKVLLI
jgi:hypothetical protein